MMLSMLGIILKYKTCAWIGLLIAAVSFANIKANYDGKQVMSTFMLSMSSVIMSYLTNPQPISVYLSQSAAVAAAVAGQSVSLDTGSAGSPGVGQ